MFNLIAAQLTERGRNLFIAVASVAIAAALIGVVAFYNYSNHIKHYTVHGGQCRVEQSTTVEGYEVIYYPNNETKHLPTGFVVPCRGSGNTTNGE